MTLWHPPPRRTRGTWLTPAGCRTRRSRTGGRQSTCRGGGAAGGVCVLEPGGAHGRLGLGACTTEHSTVAVLHPHTLAPNAVMQSQRLRGRTYVNTWDLSQATGSRPAHSAAARVISTCACSRARPRRPCRCGAGRRRGGDQADATEWNEGEGWGRQGFCCARHAARWVWPARGFL